MAVTNVIAMDLGSVPLVWVVPLSIYLLSFVLTFGPAARYPKVFAATWPLASAPKAPDATMMPSPTKTTRSGA